MGEINFTDEEVQRAKAAMTKETPLNALRAIASGLGTFRLTDDGRDVMILRWRGRDMADPEFPERRGAFFAGAWPLYRAGMIDRDCNVTVDGLIALSTALHPSETAQRREGDQ